MTRDPWLRWGPSETGDAEGPTYFRSTFPYSLPPLTEFERDAVALDPAPEIWITDTTFRDGQQARPRWLVHHHASRAQPPYATVA